MVLLVAPSSEQARDEALSDVSSTNISGHDLNKSAQSADAHVECLWFLPCLVGLPGIRRCRVVVQDATPKSEASSVCGLSQKGFPQRYSQYVCYSAAWDVFLFWKKGSLKQMSSSMSYPFFSPAAGLRPILTQSNRELIRHNFLFWAERFDRQMQSKKVSRHRFVHTTSVPLAASARHAARHALTGL